MFSAFIAVPLLAALVLWLVPPEYAAIRVGAVLYALLALPCSCPESARRQHHPARGAVRGAAADALAVASWPPRRDRRQPAAALLAARRPGARRPQGQRRPVDRAGLLRAAADGSSNASPTHGEFRIQIPPTANRWEAAYVAPEYPIARGWLRQLESDDFDLFSDGNLDAAAYLDWLEEHAVSYVAVPAAPRDYIAEDEVELIDAGLQYLEPVWESDNWRLYGVEAPTPRGVDPKDPDRFGLEVARRVYSTSISASRYWGGEGCLRPHGDGHTVVEAASAERSASSLAAAGGAELDAEQLLEPRRRSRRGRGGASRSSRPPRHRRSSRAGRRRTRPRPVRSAVARRRAGRSRAAACAGRPRPRSRLRRRSRSRRRS